MNLSEILEFWAGFFFPFIYTHNLTETWDVNHKKPILIHFGPNLAQISLIKNNPETIIVQNLSTEACFQICCFKVLLHTRREADYWEEEAVQVEVLKHPLDRMSVDAEGDAGHT